MNNNPIYLNWEFWTAIVAAMALVLSQIPPIYQLLRRAKLTMEIYPRIAIGHKIGYPNVQLGIVLSNSGGRQVRIKKITIMFSRDGTEVVTLPAQLYSPESEPTKMLLFTGFKVIPNEERVHNFHFFLNLPRNQEREVSDKTVALIEDINAKRAIPANKDILVEADLVHVQPFHDMLDRNYMWIHGEYLMNIKVETSDPRVYVEKKYRFTLFESDSKQLRDFETKYKYGEGIYFGFETQWVYITIIEG